MLSTDYPTSNSREHRLPEHTKPTTYPIYIQLWKAHTTEKKSYQSLHSIFLDAKKGESLDTKYSFFPGYVQDLVSKKI